VLRNSLALITFAIAFGYVEASVVVYLRHIYEPLRHALYPDRAASDLFPLIPIARLSSEHMRLLAVELGREAATLLMLAGVGLLAARQRDQWVAGFAIAFGIWDISFYAFLKLFLDWPASLLTWDILFLLPVPWVAPVLAPVIVSAVMIVCGFIALRLEWTARPVHLSSYHWIGLIVGAVVIILSFTWNYRALLTGAPPEHFKWTIFFGGLLIGLGSFAHAWLRRSQPGGVLPSLT
jgi:hypothetical protein